jgi:hypothetical protein
MKLVPVKALRMLLCMALMPLCVGIVTFGQQLVESFDVRGHEIPVRLWTDGEHYKMLTALPLSVKRSLHSFWGGLIAASDGRLYLPPATHSDLGASIWVVRYDPNTFMMDMVFEARKTFGKQIGFDGLWDSKIHTGIKEGRNGKLYFAGMIGGSYATMYTHMVHPSGYMGGHIYEYDLKTGVTADLGIPHRYSSIIAADLDLEKNIFYLLDWPQSEFLIYPLDTRIVRNLGTVSYHPTGPNNKRLQWGRDIFVWRDHTVWTSNNFGCFVKYDPAIDDLVDTSIALPKNDVMRVHVFGRGPSEGKVYGSTAAGWLFEFDPQAGKLVDLGAVTDKGPVYSPNLCITPDGETLYYIAGTHGDEIKGGMQIVRYSIRERKMTRCGVIGRESIPAFYCYGAVYYNGRVYFNIHGGDPSNSYMLIYDPADDKVIADAAKGGRQ